MIDRVTEMRKMIDSLMLTESEELNELMGFNKEKSREKHNKKIDKKNAQAVFISLKNAFKDFVSGKSNLSGPHAGKKYDSKDPKTIRNFLHLAGFDMAVAKQLVGESFFGEGTLIQEQLLNEFFGGGNSDEILKKAAEYAVENNVPVGQGQAGKPDMSAKEPEADSAGKKGTDDSAEATTGDTDEGDPGLDRLETQIAGLIKRISPKAAEILDVKLYDGLDLKAEQVKALVERNPNNAVNLLALVGFAYLEKKMKGGAPKQSPEKAAAPAKRSVDIQ